MLQVDQIIAELLARGDINEDTTRDLNRMLSEWRDGKLFGDDEQYLRAFHARIFEAPMPDPEPDSAPAQLDGLTLSEWRDRAIAAEARLAELEAAAKV